MESDLTENLSKPEEKKNRGWFMRYIILHKAVLILLFVILIVFVWAWLTIGYMKRDFATRTNEIVQKYEVKIDSLNMARMELTATVFSWAIRSEMIRENLEQVNQFFLSFIKESDVIKLQLINPQDGMIILSTDKKDEGQFISDSVLLAAENVLSVKDSLQYRISSPIMGLNSKIGILVIEVKNK